VVRLPPQPGETVETVLERLGISPAEVYHIFLNGSILTTRNSMAPWLRYQEACACDHGLDAPVEACDRLGPFASDMTLLVV
jgi:hypothetical protein